MKSQKTHKHDRNFDDLSDRFAKKVYDTVKGDWRLELLKQDLSSFCQYTSLQIWDAGCGQAQISLWLAKAGHHLTLCDISSKMLDKAKASFDAARLAATFYHQSAQSLAMKLPKVDLVLCHAVIEWLAQPLPSLLIIADKVKTGGFLSILFYNRNAMVYSNVLKGGWRLQNILDNRYLGKGNKLTPPNPQFPHEVLNSLETQGFELKQQTGIRIFHDYMDVKVREQSHPDEIFALEAQYCRLPTYRDMGRYIHMLLQRKPDDQ